MDILTSLPTDCLPEILGRTSPTDASRLAVISKGFQSAADSDLCWQRFVPSEIISRSVSPLVHGSKKELYFSLCNSPVLLDGGKLSFWLDRKSGKRCFMVGARDLTISGGGNPESWDWTSHADSRFSEVAQLKFASFIDIRGRIKSQMLSEKTTYGVYLVFRLVGGYYGFESVYSVVRSVNIETESDAEERANLLHLHQAPVMYRCPRPRQPGVLPVGRANGWMEIVMDFFDNDEGDGGDVEARLMEIWRPHAMRGLVIEGIEFRPMPPVDHRSKRMRA